MEDGGHRRLVRGGGFLSKGGILKGVGEGEGVLGERSFQYQQPFNKMLLLSMMDGCFGR